MPGGSRSGQPQATHCPPRLGPKCAQGLPLVISGTRPLKTIQAASLATTVIPGLQRGQVQRAIQTLREGWGVGPIPPDWLGVSHWPLRRWGCPGRCARETCHQPLALTMRPPAKPSTPQGRNSRSQQAQWLQEEAAALPASGESFPPSKKPVPPCPPSLPL